MDLILVHDRITNSVLVLDQGLSLILVQTQGLSYGPGFESSSGYYSNSSPVLSSIFNFVSDSGSVLVTVLGSGLRSKSGYGSEFRSESR